MHMIIAEPVIEEGWQLISFLKKIVIWQLCAFFNSFMTDVPII